MDSNKIKEIKMELASMNISNSANREIYDSAIAEIKNGKDAVIRKAKNLLADLPERNEMSADSGKVDDNKFSLKVMFGECKGCKKNILIAGGITFGLVLLVRLFKKAKDE